MGAIWYSGFSAVNVVDIQQEHDVIIETGEHTGHTSSVYRMNETVE